jgi:LysR family transcriptional activator of nhaA
LNVKAYNHVLGQSSVSLFAPQQEAECFGDAFPESLKGAPMLLPGHTSALRRGLEDWLDQTGVAPRVLAEFDDSALMKAFGEGGIGIFPAPTAIASEVERMYHVRRIGEVDNVSENYYAISPERKLKHPAVVRIMEAARTRLFG